MNFDTSRKDVGESWWIFTEKASRIAGRIGSQGNLSANEEVAKDNNFSVPRGRDLLIKRGSPSARRDLGLSEDK
jgi:hypothetical protein